MKQCGSCSSDVPNGSRFCPSCGVDVAAVDETVTTPRIEAPAPPPPRDASSASSSDTIDDARFTPGTVLAERYRIVGLLGKGGMGEVYRADDLKLRQPVALKFLPAALSKDQAKLERFHHEVRVARQVSHPNVCRVYDIGDSDGQPFITMEYVDGEDLAGVLRRMGKPSPDKSLEIARQLCAGLAAAHDKGILHRDLKPHNVMIDGEGRVRITDFGLAGFVKEFTGREVTAGTPAYMAPEQIAGRGVSVKSDIYSLGLVLFELFTGRRLFDGTTREQVERLRSTTAATTLTTISGDVDPAVERVILRCLEIEPSARPSSALAVAAALPGGDPLAAALAAGETPDPSMVAAAGGIGGMRPRVAVPLLVATLLGVLLCVVLSHNAHLVNLMPMVHPPEVLATKARELLARLGHTDTPVDSAHGFVAEDVRKQHTMRHDTAPDRWDRYVSERPSAIQFWYRESPDYLAKTVFFGGRAGGVSPGDPPLSRPGMALVLFEPDGRLLTLSVVPPRTEEPTASDAGAPDWTPLFEQAGLSAAELTSVPSTWIPPRWSDTRTAWTGFYPDRPDLPIRIEAAAFRGKPVYFELIFPWTQPPGAQATATTAGQKIGMGIITTIFLTVVLGSVLIAVRNLRLGRGDRRGAMRVSVFVVAASYLGWLFSTNHVPTFYELGLFVMTSAGALFGGTLVWLLYVALEPYARRRWPHALISWTRLLSGRVKDPLVGRDVLVGCLFGVAVALVFSLRQSAPALLGLSTPSPAVGNLNSLLGAKSILATFFGAINFQLFLALGLFFLLFLLRSLLRNIWLAGGAMVALFVANAVFQTDTPVVQAATVGVLVSLWVVVLARFGLLTLAVAIAMGQLLSRNALTYDLGAWYGGATLFAVGLSVALAAFAFHIALAGRPIFKDTLAQPS